MKRLARNFGRGARRFSPGCGWKRHDWFYEREHRSCRACSRVDEYSQKIWRS